MGNISLNHNCRFRCALPLAPSVRAVRCAHSAPTWSASVAWRSSSCPCHRRRPPRCRWSCTDWSAGPWRWPRRRCCWRTWSQSMLVHGWWTRSYRATVDGGVAGWVAACLAQLRENSNNKKHTKNVSENLLTNIVNFTERMQYIGMNTLRVAIKFAHHKCVGVYFLRWTSLCVCVNSKNADRVNAKKKLYITFNS